MFWKQFGENKPISKLMLICWTLTLEIIDIGQEDKSQTKWSNLIQQPEIRARGQALEFQRRPYIELCLASGNQSSRFPIHERPLDQTNRINKGQERLRPTQSAVGSGVVPEGMQGIVRLWLKWAVHDIHSRCQNVSMKTAIHSNIHNNLIILWITFTNLRRLYNLCSSRE